MCLLVCVFLRACVYACMGACVYYLSEEIHCRVEGLGFRAPRTGPQASFQAGLAADCDRTILDLTAFSKPLRLKKHQGEAQKTHLYKSKNVRIKLN